MVEMLKNMLQQDWFWAMMQFFIVAATLYLIYRQIKIQTATHIVQTLSNIVTRWNSETMLRARLKVCSDFIHGEKEFGEVSSYIATFMEELGVYVQINAIPAKVLWEAQSWPVEHYYCMFKDGIDHLREFHKDINFYTQFESLYKKMNEINREKGSPAFIRRDEELKRFARNEIELCKAFLQLREEINGDNSQTSNG